MEKRQKRLAVLLRQAGVLALAGTLFWTRPFPVFATSQAEREKQLRRSGLLLAEPQVLQAMEHEALTEPRYLPLRVNKSGDLSGSLASAAQLGKLGRYVDKLLRDIAGEIRGGVIDADPCCHTEEDSPCRYCDWAPACHFQDGRDGDRLHYILPVKPGEFWQEIEGKEAD